MPNDIGDSGREWGESRQAMTSGLASSAGKSSLLLIGSGYRWTQKAMDASSLLAALRLDGQTSGQLSLAMSDTLEGLTKSLWTFELTVFCSFYPT